MGQMSIQDIQKSLTQWDFLQQLPKEVAGFNFVQYGSIDGQLLKIAAFENAEQRVSLELYFTSETNDYIVVKNIGFQQFRDIRYIFRERDRFAEKLSQDLTKLLNEILPSCRHSLGEVARECGLDAWTYASKLPQHIGNYELYIAPQNAIEYINGSIIFIDYSDFANGNQLVFFYNRFRGEIFAEAKCKMNPVYTTEFDVTKMNHLDAILDKRLESFLRELSQ